MLVLKLFPSKQEVSLHSIARFTCGTEEMVLSYHETGAFFQLPYRQATKVKEFKTIKDEDKKISKR